MRFMVAVAMVLAMSACAADPAGTGESQPKRSRLEPVAATVAPLYRKNGSVSGYQWNGKSFSAEPELSAAMEQAITQNMANLPPHQAVDGLMRVILPNPRKFGDDPVWRADMRLIQARADALRVSGAFGAVRSEREELSRFQAGNGEWVLRPEGKNWRLKDAVGREIAVDGGGDLGQFVDNAAAAAEELRQDSRFLRVLKAGSKPDGVVYGGREYATLVALTDAFDRDNAAMAARVVPTRTPLGGRARLIIPTRAGDSMLLPGETQLALGFARKAFVLALDKRLARMVQAAKLFDAVQVDFDNVVQPPQDDFDWVLWRVPETAQWSVRGKGGLARQADLPLTPESFAADFITAVTLPQLAPVPQPMAVPEAPVAAPAVPAQQESNP